VVEPPELIDEVRGQLLVALQQYPPEPGLPPG
jgi:hypothetical protein